ncbi:hypothetical protein RR48_01601 [Papilio machaon]|uniref:Uncharacterized protein n=1 Tax=Papilio machaon TaxID=76193 RepID=A0A0N0PBV7_PAPMA|nr:hypothetical protein RR48_01601 [Papilio machaon]
MNNLILTLSLIIHANSALIEPDHQGHNAPIVIENSAPILRGALVDQYTGQALIIKIKSPSEIIKDSLSLIAFDRMDSQIAQDLRLTFGNLETHYQKQFKEVLSIHQELIATPYPLEVSEGNGRLIDISKYSRSKRSVWWRMLNFLRSVRPAARIAGKLTRYGKFMKGAKYAGYAASAAVFTYEMADIFGALPDKKYEEVSRQLEEIHAARTTDLIVMKNITIFTTGLHESIRDTTSQLNRVVSESYDKYEMYVKSSQILNSYIQQINIDLILIRLGGIPSNIITIENQRVWLERKLPSLLLSDISTITPHLRTTLKAIDEEKNQIVLYVEIPTLGTDFQLLNFVRWEPELVIEETCYSSPRKELYFAFRRDVGDGVIEDPLLIDPESCLTSGFILCESDAILETIPQLSENRICTQRRLKNKRRNKRSSANLFDMAQHPTYDLSQIVQKTFNKEHKIEQAGDSITSISKIIDQLIEESRKNEVNSKILLEQASRDDKIIKAFLSIGALLLLIGAIWVARSICYSLLEKKKHRSTERTEQLIRHIASLEDRPA